MNEHENLETARHNNLESREPPMSNEAMSILFVNRDRNEPVQLVLEDGRTIVVDVQRISGDGRVKYCLKLPRTIRVLHRERAAEAAPDAIAENVAEAAT